MKGKIRVLLLTLGIAIVVLSGCSKEKEEEVIPVSKEEEKETIIEQEDPVEEIADMYASPFTGLMLEEEQTRRPVLATINNHPQARPQSGIGDADIVYELVAEGNVTRLLALFQSELPEEIGPIRSARDYFLYIAKGLDAFYVAHGYSPDAHTLLKKNYLDNVNGMQYDGTLFWRSKDRKAPHNSYISGENILTAEEKTNSSLEIEKGPALSFHDTIDSAKIGDIASVAVVRYGSDSNFHSTYSYDASKGTYDRTVKGILTVDKASGEQVKLSNVLVFEAVHRTIDNAGRQAIDIESGGKALLFQAGFVKEIEWKNIDGILTPIANGVPVQLVPGKTWIHIVPSKPGMASSVTYTP
jgi:hypothetical protein